MSDPVDAVTPAGADSGFASVEAIEAAMEAGEFDAEVELSQSDWDNSDPVAVSQTQEPTDWEAGRESTETPVVEAVSEVSETAVDVAPAQTPTLDKVDRLAELVEKLLTAKDPEPQAAPTPEPEPIDPRLYIKQYEQDPDYRIHVMKQLGFTQPEHWENPHVVRLAEMHLREVVRDQREAQLESRLARFEEMQAAEKAQATAEARDRAAAAEVTAAFAVYDKIPEKTLTALTTAIKTAVARGTEPKVAIAAVLDAFGDVLPKKAAKAAPAPTPAAPTPKSQDPARAQRDARIAARPRASGQKRTLTQELRALESGRGWS